jgi:hypothetical protein
VPLASPTAAGATLTPVAIAVGTPEASPAATVEPTLAAEVGQAYEQYWRVRAQALLQLDPTHLPEVMDGEHLAAVSQAIEQLRSEGRAIKSELSLNYTVIQADAEMATVFDHIDDNSYYVQAGTEQPLTQPAKGVLTGLFRLRKNSGVWKVVESVRSS